MESTITLTDAQLHAAYAESLDNFRMPEKIRVRHILIKTTGKSDAEKKTLRAKADDLLKQLKNGGRTSPNSPKRTRTTRLRQRGAETWTGS